MKLAINMKYIEAVNDIHTDIPWNFKRLFLAGSITGATDWQEYVVSKIKDLNIVVYNPRRKKFPINDPNVAYEQIEWEHKALRKAEIISFWFAKETMAPITLYELGAWSMTHKDIIIGVDPDYPRKQDVQIQTKLLRPDINIVYSLDDLILKIKESI